MKAFKFLINTLAYAAVALLIGMAVLSHGSNGMAVFGKQYVAIMSDSMGPEFGAGSLIINDVPPADADKLDVGDVITFKITNQANKEFFISHRIESVATRGGERVFRTKGDSAETHDGFYVGLGDVVGVYTGKSIPLLGSILAFLSSYYGIVAFTACAVLVVAAVYVLEQHTIQKRIAQAKEKAKVAVAEASAGLQNAMEAYKKSKQAPSAEKATAREAVMLLIKEEQRLLENATKATEKVSELEKKKEQKPKEKLVAAGA